MNFINKEDNFKPIINSQNSTFILSEGAMPIAHLNELYLYKCEFNKDSFQLSLFDDFNIQFVNTLTNAVDKRKAEYLAGRYCANKALKQLNIYNVNIIPGIHRAPVWPEGITGSITHTKNHAFSAVAYKNNYTYLGIDYEKIMNKKTANEVSSTIIHQGEYCLLNNTGWCFEKSLTLTFSAKESLFKALYPHVGKYFDFSVAELVSFSDQYQNFELILLESLSYQLTKGMSFKGWFEKTDSHIFTIIAL